APAPPGDARPPDRASAAAARRTRTDRRRGSRLQLRNVVAAIGAGVEVEHGPHRAEIELAIEVRKQLVVARALPAQGLAQRVGVDLDQEQPGLTEKVFPRSLCDLGGSRQMNITVTDIVRAAAIDALPLGLAPGGCGTNFINCGHCCCWPCWGF